jgi:hypothetical protein
MKPFFALLLFVVAAMTLFVRDQAKSNAGEDAPVVLAGQLRKTKQPSTAPDKPATAVRGATAPLPPRIEQFTKSDTIEVGDFSIDLCRRAARGAAGASGLPAREGPHGPPLRP